MSTEQLDLFGNPIPSVGQKKEKAKPAARIIIPNANETPAEEKKDGEEETDNASPFVYADNNIIVKIKLKVPVAAPVTATEIIENIIDLTENDIVFKAEEAIIENADSSLLNEEPVTEIQDVVIANTPFVQSNQEALQTTEDKEFKAIEDVILPIIEVEIETNPDDEIPAFINEPLIVENYIKDPVDFLPETIGQVQKAVIPNSSKRGRKSYKDLETAIDLINIPDEATLNQKLYYGITEVAGWFNVNVSQIRFWENEFDVLQPRKTKKGDRLFRVEDIKNLQLIYHLVRQKKLSLEGTKAYLKSNKHEADVNFELVKSLTKFRLFLLELKAGLGE